MKLARAFAVSLVLSCSAVTPAFGETLRDYICAVEQKAGIGAAHLEGSGTPQAFVSRETPTRFGMRITREEGRGSHAAETSYAGPDRDPYEWQTANSVLHGAYSSDDGENFVATEDQAFLRILTARNGTLRFYHAGFEYPGGEDTNLSVRWGTCVLRR